MLTLYGLKTCDTCRKARKWLDAKGIAHSFRDVRADGLAARELARWTKALGAEALLNRRGTTWRALSDRERRAADNSGAQALMLAHPALIKRPVFEAEDRVIVGFGTAQQKELLRLIG